MTDLEAYVKSEGRDELVNKSAQRSKSLELHTFIISLFQSLGGL